MGIESSCDETSAAVLLNDKVLSNCIASQGALERAFPINFFMARVKWETMTDESQAMVKKVGLISLGGVILLAFSKMIFPLVLLGGGSYVAWRSLFKK